MRATFNLPPSAPGARHRCCPRGGPGWLNAYQLAVANLATDVESQPVARRYACAQLYDAAVVAADGDAADADAPRGVHDRHLRTAGTEHQRSCRYLHQAAWRQVEADLEVHPGHELALRIGDVHLHAQRARLRIERLRGAGHLAVVLVHYTRARLYLYRGPGVEQVVGRALRRIDEDADRVVLRHHVQRRRCRSAACGHEVADIDVAHSDH